MLAHTCIYFANEIIGSNFQQLDSVYSDVKAMNECCQDMTNRLKVYTI